MLFPKKIFPVIAARPIEWHVMVLSLAFGLLFAWKNLSPQNRDPVFFLTLSLSSGVGFVYASSYFLTWLVKVSGPVVPPQLLRMVVGYSLTPFTLSLFFMMLADHHYLPRLPFVYFVFVVMTWGLMVYGIQHVARIPVIQALFVTVIPVLALMLAIAILFKVAWMIYGY